MFIKGKKLSNTGTEVRTAQSAASFCILSASIWGDAHREVSLGSVDSVLQLRGCTLTADSGTLNLPEWWDTDLEHGSKVVWCATRHDKLPFSHSWAWSSLSDRGHWAELSVFWGTDVFWKLCCNPMIFIGSGKSLHKWLPCLPSAGPCSHWSLWSLQLLLVQGGVMVAVYNFPGRWETPHMCHLESSAQLSKGDDIVLIYRWADCGQRDQPPEQGRTADAYTS